MDSLKAWMARAAHAGTRGADPQLAKRLVLSNRMAIAVAAVAALILAPVFYFSGSPGLAFFTFPVGSVYLLVIVLNALGYTRFSRIYHIACANLLVSGMCLYFGPGSGFYIHFFSTLMIALLLTGKEERGMLIGAMALTASCVAALALHNLLGWQEPRLSPEAMRRLFFTNVFLCLLLNGNRIYNFFQESQATEEALSKALEAARSADKAKTRFLANMSHEIRTPLSGILGLTELMERSHRPEDHRDSLRSIRSSANDLLDIINEILDLSKIESGKMRLEKIDFHLGELIASLKRLFLPLASRKNLAFEVDVAPEVPASLAGDPVRLKQVLNNLLANAFKFTEKGGVTLRVRPETPGGAQTPRAGTTLLLFEVEDTGIGLPDTAKEWIFQAFSQGGASTTRQFGGTGLGLHISRQIVELMEGTIGFRARPGGGTIFHFTAALEEAAPAPKAGPPVFAQAFGGSGGTQPGEAPALSGDAAASLRVLIVDDNAINMRVLQGMLSLHGVEADTAGDGAQALEACARPYDLILMDSHMPGMDGYACTRALRARERERPESRPVIIGVTADAMAGSRERCLEAGMDDMITKPVMDRDLRRILERWVGHGGGDAPGAAGIEDTVREEAAASGVEAPEWIDRRQLEALEAWVTRYNPSFRDKAVEQFEEAYARLTSKIRAACSQGRFQEAGEAAHALKGVCLSLGLRRMGEICHSLEALGLGGSSARWPALLEDLAAAKTHSLAEWRLWSRT